MQVVFRVDASLGMGSGHVMRSLTLAGELKNRNCSSLFICRPSGGDLISFIQKKGFPVAPLPEVSRDFTPGKGSLGCAHWLEVPWQQDSDETAAILKERDIIDWLIVDHYGLDYRWHGALRGHVNKIMVVDDLADRKHDCDILLDQNLGRDSDDYSSLVSRSCRCLIGTDYALLRPQFADSRKQALARRRNFSGKTPHVLVSMGGMDSGNLSSRVVSALEMIDWSEPPRIDIIFGKNSPHAQTVTQKAEKSALDIEVHQNVMNMAEYMTQADLAIGTGGTTSWERCCLALPSILIVDAQNQEVIARELNSAEAVVRLYSSSELENELAVAVKNILFGGKLYGIMSKNASAICDGNGALRVVDELCRNV